MSFGGEQVVFLCVCICLHGSAVAFLLDDDPCRTALTLPSLPQRHFGYVLKPGERWLCDYNLLDYWYKMDGYEIATSNEDCGTKYPWHINGSLPTNGTMDVLVCKDNKVDDTCADVNTIQVKACPDGAFVYHLPPTPTCPDAYCIETRPPRDCSEVLDPDRQSGTHTIYPFGTKTIPVSVFCEFYDNNTVWTVIQRRFNGSVDFYRNWEAYKNGFGSSAEEYWIGNDILHRLTANSNQELKIVMSDFSNVTKYADYTTFHVADEAAGYRLTIGGYSGTAGDAMSYHNRMMFSTLDRDNDSYTPYNCANVFKGAWWYRNCHEANLNGLYLSANHHSYGDGIAWAPWHGDYYSLKSTVMMVKRN